MDEQNRQSDRDEGLAARNAETDEQDAQNRAKADGLGAADGHRLLEMRAEDETVRRARRARAWKEVREWAVSLGVALVVVLLIRTFLFTIIRVDGSSMQDTLFTGERLFVTIADMKLHGPDRYDVVIVHYPNRTENFVKRIIGLPGDTLSCKGGVMYVDGEALNETYLSPEHTKRFRAGAFDFDGIVIPEGCYFVMGDNRDDSNDSRNVGLLEEGMLVGKVRCIIWPLGRIGGIS